MTDIRAEKYAYEKEKSREKEEDRAQKERLTQQGIQIRDLAMANCSPTNLSSPTRLSGGGSSSSGGGGSGGAGDRSAGRSSGRSTPNRRRGVGADVMDRLIHEFHFDSEDFMKKSGITAAQYKLFVDGDWSEDDISPDLEEDLFHDLVGCITEVSPRGAYNGSHGNMPAAKEARSEMRWPGIGKERLDLLCRRFTLKAADVMADMPEAVLGCDEYDVDAWVKGWEGEDLHWTLADAMNAFFSERLIEGCRRSHLHGPDVDLVGESNSRGKCKRERKKRTAKYSTQESALDRYAYTIV